MFFRRKKIWLEEICFKNVFGLKRNFGQKEIEFFCWRNISVGNVCQKKNLVGKFFIKNNFDQKKNVCQKK